MLAAQQAASDNIRLVYPLVKWIVLQEQSSRKQILANMRFTGVGIASDWIYMNLGCSNWKKCVIA